MAVERRASAREILSLPIVLVDGSTAMTRDLSAEGLYFHVPGPVALDDWISFEYAMPDCGLRFLATGEVVRTEPGATGTGVAMRLHSPRLLPLA